MDRPEKDRDLSCGVTSPQHPKENQRKHQDLHKNSYRAFTCLLCNKVFKRSQYARKHILKFHSHVATDNVNKYVGREGDEPVDEDNDGMRYMLADSEVDTEDEVDIVQNESAVESNPGGNSVIMCDQCGITFATKRNMHRHRRKIHGLYERKKETFVPCDLCDKTFGSTSYLERHRREIHGIYKKKKRKEIPEKKNDDATEGDDDTENEEEMHVEGNESLEQASEWRSFEKMNDHDTEVKDRQNLGVDSASACDQNRHKRDVHGLYVEKKTNSVLECDQCGKIFKSRPSKYKHRRKIHGLYVNKKRKENPEKKNYVDTECDDETENEEEMHVEGNESLEEQALEWRSFEKKNDNDTEVKDWQNLGVDSASTCDQCGKTYRNKMLKNRHRREVHGLYVEKKTDSSLECDQCGKIYRNKISKNRHRREVHGLYVKKKTKENPEKNDDDDTEGDYDTENEEGATVEGNESLEQASEGKSFDKKNDDETKVNTDESLEYKTQDLLGSVAGSSDAFEVQGKLHSHTESLTEQRRQVHGLYLKDIKEGDTYVEETEYGLEVENIRKEDLIPDGSAITCDICGKIYNRKASLQTHRRKVHGVYATDRRKIHWDKMEQSCASDEVDASNVIQLAPQPSVSADITLETLANTAKSPVTKESVKCVKKKNEKTKSPEQKDNFMVTAIYSDSSTCAERRVSLSPQKSDAAQKYKYAANKYKRNLTIGKNSVSHFSIGSKWTTASRNIDFDSQGKVESADNSSSADADNSPAAVVIMQSHESSEGFHSSAFLYEEMKPAKETTAEVVSPMPQEYETGETIPQKSEVCISKSTKQVIETMEVTNATVQEIFNLTKPTISERLAKETLSKAKTENSKPSREVALEKMKKVKIVLAREEPKGLKPIKKATQNVHPKQLTQRLKPIKKTKQSKKMTRTKQQHPKKT